MKLLYFNLIWTKISVIDVCTKCTVYTYTHTHVQPHIMKHSLSSPSVCENIYKTDSDTCAISLLRVGSATNYCCRIFDGHLPTKTGQREAFDCNGRGSAVCSSFIVIIKCGCIYMSCLIAFRSINILRIQIDGVRYEYWCQKYKHDSKFRQPKGNWTKFRFNIYFLHISLV